MRIFEMPLKAEGKAYSTKQSYQNTKGLRLMNTWKNEKRNLANQMQRRKNKAESNATKNRNNRIN